MNEVRALAKQKGVQIDDYRDWNIFRFDNGATFHELAQFDGDSEPVSGKDVNDRSLVAKLTFGPTTVLFPGDINIALSRWLYENHSDWLKADILKFPHHGAESFAIDEFIKATQAKTFLVPAPLRLWCAPRTQRTRDLSQQMNADLQVNGMNGNIFVTFTKQGYSISPELTGGAAKSCPPA